MLLVASMALALRQLAAEQARGRSVREALRATLAMEVDLGSGTQNDVLVTDRPSRKAYPLAEAVRILRKERGTHLYCPAVQALLRLLARNTALSRKAS